MSTPSAERCQPDLLLDAGSESLAVLFEGLTRRLEEMAAGQVLEVDWTAPGIEFEISNWCATTGHELLAVDAHEAGARFWIRRKQPDGPAAKFAGRAGG